MRQVIQIARVMPGDIDRRVFPHSRKNAGVQAGAAFAPLDKKDLRPLDTPDDGMVDRAAGVDSCLSRHA